MSILEAPIEAIRGNHAGLFYNPHYSQIVANSAYGSIIDGLLPDSKHEVATFINSLDLGEIVTNFILKSIFAPIDAYLGTSNPYFHISTGEDDANLQTILQLNEDAIDTEGTYTPSGNIIYNNVLNNWKVAETYAGDVLTIEWIYKNNLVLQYNYNVVGLAQATDNLFQEYVGGSYLGYAVDTTNKRGDFTVNDGTPGHYMLEFEVPPLYYNIGFNVKFYGFATVADFQADSSYEAVISTYKALLASYLGITVDDITINLLDGSVIFGTTIRTTDETKSLQIQNTFGNEPSVKDIFTTQAVNQINGDVAANLLASVMAFFFRSGDGNDLSHIIPPSITDPTTPYITEDNPITTTVTTSVGEPTEGDVDNDGTPDHQDDDIDGDGILNENDGDADGDGILNENDDTPNGLVAATPTPTPTPTPTTPTTTLADVLSQIQEDQTETTYFNPVFGLLNENEMFSTSMNSAIGNYYFWHFWNGSANVTIETKSQRIDLSYNNGHNYGTFDLYETLLVIDTDITNITFNPDELDFQGNPHTVITEESDISSYQSYVTNVYYVRTNWQNISVRFKVIKVNPDLVTTPTPTQTLEDVLPTIKNDVSGYDYLNDGYAYTDSNGDYIAYPNTANYYQVIPKELVYPSGNVTTNAVYVDDGIQYNGGVNMNYPTERGYYQTTISLILDQTQDINDVKFADPTYGFADSTHTVIEEISDISTYPTYVTNVYNVTFAIMGNTIIRFTVIKVNPDLVTTPPEGGGSASATPTPTPTNPPLLTEYGTDDPLIFYNNNNETYIRTGTFSVSGVSFFSTGTPTLATPNLIYRVDVPNGYNFRIFASNYSMTYEWHAPNGKTNVMDDVHLYNTLVQGELLYLYWTSQTPSLVLALEINLLPLPVLPSRFLNIGQFTYSGAETRMDIKLKGGSTVNDIKFFDYTNPTSSPDSFEDVTTQDYEVEIPAVITQMVFDNVNIFTEKLRRTDSPFSGFYQIKDTDFVDGDYIDLYSGDPMTLKMSLKIKYLT